MQKLVGKLAHLAAPWIYKLMLHLYTSLASASKKNKELLTKSSPGFRELCVQINKKQFNIDHSTLQKEVCYAIKQAAKTNNHHKIVYKFNKTMWEELNLFAQALSATPSIKFVTLIAFLIVSQTKERRVGEKQICNVMDVSSWLDNDDQTDRKKNESWGWHNLGAKLHSEQGRKWEVQRIQILRIFFSQGQITKYVGRNRYTYVIFLTKVTFPATVKRS